MFIGIRNLYHQRVEVGCVRGQLQSWISWQLLFVLNDDINLCNHKVLNNAYIENYHSMNITIAIIIQSASKISLDKTLIMENIGLSGTSHVLN